MGVADIIPGVSGGTVALILGIYARLVGAISHCDRQWLNFISARRWRDAAAHIDLWFLIPLALGIATGILSMGMIIHELIHSDFARPLTFAAFFGMIGGSTLLVVRLVRIDSWPQFICMLLLAWAAAGFAWWLTTLGLAASEEPGMVYLFLCGMIAICAMILPGISGAHLLLILGAYVFVTGTLKGLMTGDVSVSALVSLAVFACGCLIGLLSFSKVLRWLLTHHNSATMAVLCGFMIGAMRKVWIFQDLEQVEVGGKMRDELIPYWPEQFGGHEWLAIAVAVFAFVAVLLVDYFAKMKKPKEVCTSARAVDKALT